MVVRRSNLTLVSRVESVQRRGISRKLRLLDKNGCRRRNHEEITYAAEVYRAGRRAGGRAADKK